MALLTSPSDGHSAEQAYARRWWTLAVLCLSLLIVFGGNSTLNVALPTLSRDLGATESQLQWVVAAYSLVFAGMLFTSGALGDRFGRKGALQLGLGIFFLASLVASQATNTNQIIACRAVMGLGAAFIMPSTLSILVNVFPPRERAKAIAIWATTTGIAGSIGPIITGYVLGHFWFGSAFLVYLPVIALALVGGWFVVPKSRDPDESRLDPIGALLSIVGVSTLVFGLIQAPQEGWGAPVTLGAFAIAALVLAVFVWWEMHTDEPMLDMHYFRNPAFSVGSGAMMLVFLAMYGVMFLMTQYFQLVLGFSALGAALRLVPDRDDHAGGDAVHPAHHVPLRQQPGGVLRHGAHRAGLLPVHPARPAHPALVRVAGPRPAHDRRLDVDVADDRVDHVGRPGEPRRRRLGDERCDARVRRRTRDRGAGKHRRLAVLESSARCARPSTGIGA